MKSGIFSKSGVLLIFILTAAAGWAGTAKFHIDVGLNHFYKKRYLEAYREFKTALERDPKSPEAHYNLGRVYKAQGFIKEALIEFQIAVKLDSGYLAAQRELAAIKKSLESDVRTQLKLQGRENVSNLPTESISGDEAEKRGRQLLQQGRTAEALRSLEQAAREKPDDAGLFKLLGFLYFRQGQYSAAAKSYGRARDLTPTDPEVFYAIGLINLKTGQGIAAEDNFRAALKFNPKMVKAVFALGEAYESQEKIEDAIFQFRKCLELNPSLKEAENKLTFLASKVSYKYFSRGSYFYQNGDYDQAESFLSLARNYGNLTPEQNQQIDEMLNASRFWISKKRAQEKVDSERKEVRQSSYINKNIGVYDVSKNPKPYLGQAVEWKGQIEYVTTKKGRKIIFVNSNNQANPDFEMDYCFEVIFPEKLPDDPRIAGKADVEIKGKVLRVEKLFNESVSAFSSRRQPIVEATEAVFLRTNYDQPLVLRFY